MCYSAILRHLNSVLVMFFLGSLLELPHSLFDVLVLFDWSLHPRDEAVGLTEPVDAVGRHNLLSQVTLQRDRKEEEEGQEDILLLSEWLGTSHDSLSVERGVGFVLVYSGSAVFHSGLSICDMTDVIKVDLYLLWYWSIQHWQYKTLKQRSQAIIEYCTLIN